MNTSSDRSKDLDPFAISVALLRKDGWFAVLLFVILSLADVLDLLAAPNGGYVLWGLLLIDRILQMTVATLVVHRWRGRLGTPGAPPMNLLLLWAKITSLGLAFWAALVLPLLAMSRATDPLVFFIASAATAAALIVSLQYFFYSSVAGFTGGPMFTMLTRARLITRTHRSSALKAFLGPFALAVLAVGLLSAPFPDGRSELWSSLASAGENLFWLLSSYTALAFTIVMLDESVWRSAGLDPYRWERLETVRIQGQGFAARLLAPKTATKVLLLSALVLLGNFTRELTMPPGPQVTVKNVEIADQSVNVVLELIDPEYHYRGFKPSWFTLASDSGYPVATGLLRASTDPISIEKLHTLPRSDEPVTLYLSFRSERSKKDLEVLENLWLWYQLKPLLALPREMLSGNQAPAGHATPVSTPTP